MKKLALIVAGVFVGLIVLAVVAVIAAPPLINWNRFKPQIADAVRNATGRELRIGGDLRISLVPKVRVSAGDIHLSNAAGMTAPDMVSVGSVRLEAELLPLLGKRVVIDSLVVQNPSVNLEVDKAGNRNWVFTAPGAAPPEAAAPPAGGGSAAAPSVQLGDVRIEQGHFAYLDATTGQTVEAKSIDLAVAMADLAQPLSVKGKMVLNDEPVATDVTIDSLQRLSQSQQAKVKLAVDAKYLAAHFDGAAQQRPVPGLDGTFDLDIASVGQLLAWLHTPLDKSRSDPGPLKVHAVFTADGAKTILKEATVSGTALKAQATGSLDASGPTTKVMMNVTSDVLDIDRYLPPPSKQVAPTPPAGRAAPPPANPLAMLSDKPLDLSALRNTDADIKVTIAGVKALGYELGRIAFAMTAKGGLMDAELSELALYGGSVKGSAKLDATGSAVGIVTSARIDHVTVDKPVQLATGKAMATGTMSAALDASAKGTSQRGLAEALAGKIALDLGGVTVKDMAPHSISGLKVDIDLPGQDKALSLKSGLVYNGEAISATATAGPMRKMLAGEKFAAKLAVASKVVTLGYDGAVQRQPVPGLDGTFDLDVPSVGKLASWLDQPLDAKQPDPGPLNAHAVLSADGAKLALKDAKITGKALKATAEGKFDGSQKVAVFDAKLDIQQADLNAYLPPQQKSAAAAPAKGAKPQASGWSTEPFDLAALGEANGQARIGIADTHYRELDVTQGNITANLSNRVLKLAVEKLAVSKGTVSSGATLDASGTGAKLDYQVAIAGMPAEPLLKTFADTDRLSGTIAFETSGKGGGRNQKELIESLNGSGQFKIVDGAINGINLAAFLRQAGSLGLQGSQAQKTDFAELSGTYTIKDGVVENRDMKMLAPLVRLTGSGTVPLPPQTVDYTVEAKLVPTTAGQGGEDALAGLPIPIRITGSWSNPSYQVDWNSVFSEMAKDPARLKNLPANLDKAAKSFGVIMPSAGSGGAGGASGVLKAIPGLPTAPASPGTPAPSEQQQPAAPGLPALPKGLFGK